MKHGLSRVLYVNVHKGAKGINMNRKEMDVLSVIWKESYKNQQILSEACGYSINIINRSIKYLMEDGYLDEELKPTLKAEKEFKYRAPKNAIILAAGLGMRMAPINTEISKGLLEVDGEPLIERLIKQLNEVGIRQIYIIVGFMKEQYEYLIDKYGVELIINVNYNTKNNLHSMNLALEHLSNTYIIPCDIWCGKNPFSRYELYSWYMVSDLIDDESNIRVNQKMELVNVSHSMGGNTMIGVCYLLEEQSGIVREKIRQLSSDICYDDLFWESALYEKNRMIVLAKVVHSSDVVEINTYEQLRDLDGGSNQLKSDAIEVICEKLKVRTDEIIDISVLKKGMTNRSFLFRCANKKYIMRIPGEGTDQLINRKNEAAVYQTINGKDICDEVIYINPKNGYKITTFLENARVCNPFDVKDLKKCMRKLKEFHKMGLKVPHDFDLFAHIEFYEALWDGTPSVYKDYVVTKEKVMSLRGVIEQNAIEKTLTHIDAVPDNFLFIKDENGQEDIRLIDWEYAGMQDPHVDIAMFCIYSLYGKRQVDRLINLYFEDGCTKENRIKIYCYISVCGLLWSNWCEYKRKLGVEFGEYSFRQYRYAKDYYRVVQKELLDY